MNLRILSYLVICLFIGIGTVIILEPASAYSDHFTSDTSANYGPDAIQWQWQTAGNGFVMPYNNSHAEYYTISTFGSGIYEWNAITWIDSHPQPQLLYGSDLTDGPPQTTGTHYLVLVYHHEGVYLRKVIAGVMTTIDSYVAEIGNGPYDIKVIWDTAAHTHKVYLDGTERISATDDSITTAGYMGMGIEVWNWFKVDEMKFTSSCISPSTIFSCIPTSGESPFDVQCTDASTGDTPFTYSWNVENQTGYGFKTSTVKNPVFNMSHLGVYNVNLSVTNACGDDWENKTGYLTITPEKPTWPTEYCDNSKLIEHYWYEDHFNNAGTFSTWIGDNPDKSNWEINTTNSSLQAKGPAPSSMLMMNKERFGNGNYSFKAKTDQAASGAAHYALGFDILFDDPALWNIFIDTYFNYAFNIPDYDIFMNDKNWNEICGSTINLVPLTEWNWYNITFYESNKLKFYINNTLICDVSLPENYDPNYVTIQNWFNPDQLVQYDYISFSNTTPTCFDNCLTDLTIKKGETWIKWNWTGYKNLTDYITDGYNLYYNGALYRNNYPFNYFLKDNLGSNSYHVVEIQWFNDTYDWNVTCSYNAIRSDPAMVWWYLIIGMGLLTIGYFVPLFGFLAILMFMLGFGMTYQEYNQSYIVLTYGLSTVIAMFITAIRLGEKR